eukprot:764678-Hanusia_phi.AAC.2
MSEGREGEEDEEEQQEWKGEQEGGGRPGCVLQPQRRPSSQHTQPAGRQFSGTLVRLSCHRRPPAIPQIPEDNPCPLDRVEALGRHHPDEERGERGG